MGRGPGCSEASRHTYRSDASLSTQDLIRGFDPRHLGRAPARHQASQLGHWQLAAVRGLDADSFQTWLFDASPELEARVPQSARTDFFAMVHDGLTVPAEAVEQAAAVFGWAEGCVVGTFGFPRRPDRSLGALRRTWTQYSCSARRSNLP